MFAPTQWATNILSNKRIDVNAGNTEHSLERGPSNDDEIVANAGNIEHLSAITYECHIWERSFFSDHGRSIHLHHCRKKNTTNTIAVNPTQNDRPTEVILVEQQRDVCV